MTNINYHCVYCEAMMPSECKCGKPTSSYEAERLAEERAKSDVLARRFLKEEPRIPERPDIAQVREDIIDDYAGNETLRAIQAQIAAKVEKGEKALELSRRLSNTLRPDPTVATPQSDQDGSVWDFVPPWHRGPLPEGVRSATEIRMTDPLTGGQKGTKPQRMDLLPWDSLMKVSEHFAKGAEKYDDRNWERGYAWHLSFAALQRHLAAWWQGEDQDEEGNDHLDAVVFHALLLRTFTLRDIGTDDRPNG